VRALAIFRPRRATGAERFGLVLGSAALAVLGVELTSGVLEPAIARSPSLPAHALKIPKDFTRIGVTVTAALTDAVIGAIAGKVNLLLLPFKVQRPEQSIEVLHSLLWCVERRGALPNDTYAMARLCSV
jgi:hypothetical protein